MRELLELHLAACHECQKHLSDNVSMITEDGRLSDEQVLDVLPYMQQFHKAGHVQ